MKAAIYIGAWVFKVLVVALSVFLGIVLLAHTIQKLTGAPEITFVSLLALLISLQWLNHFAIKIVVKTRAKDYILLSFLTLTIIACIDFFSVERLSYFSQSDKEKYNLIDIDSILVLRAKDSISIAEKYEKRLQETAQKYGQSQSIYFNLESNKAQKSEAELLFSERKREFEGLANAYNSSISAAENSNNRVVAAKGKVDNTDLWLLKFGSLFMLAVSVFFSYLIAKIESEMVAALRSVTVPRLFRGRSEIPTRNGYYSENIPTTFRDSETVPSSFRDSEDVPKAQIVSERVSKLAQIIESEKERNKVLKYAEKVEFMLDKSEEIATADKTTREQLIKLLDINKTLYYELRKTIETYKPMIENE